MKNYIKSCSKPTPLTASALKAFSTSCASQLLLLAVTTSCSGKVEVETVNEASIATSIDQSTTVVNELSKTGPKAEETVRPPDADGAQITKPELIGFDRLAAKAGEVVKVSGQNFKDQKDLEISINGTRVPLSIAPDGSAEFTMPPGISPGMGDIKLVSKTLGDLGQGSMLADAGDYPIITLNPEEVCKGKMYRNAKGEVQTGTLDCGVRPLCSASLQVDCLATAEFLSVPKTELVPAVIKSGAKVGGVTGTYPSATNPLSGADSTADLDSVTFATKIKSAAAFEFFGPDGTRYMLSGDPDLTATNILSGIEIFGTTGTVAVPPTCTANNIAGCVTTATYKSADWTNLTAANIKNGASVAGLTGTYPSSGNLLTGADATADLDSSTFDAQVKSATAFEYFGPDGTRYTGAGDADITAGNILTGTVIFGTTGSVTATPADCGSNGSQSCVATGSYFAATACAADSSNCFVPTYAVTTQPLKAISYDAIDAGKSSMRTSLTLSGIAGTLADCTTNNTSGCVTTASYKSADWTNLTAANIKSGASVAGLTGTYPSSGNLLTGANATADLDLATFDAKVKSATAFEFFGPDGTRYTNSGDADITAANIASGVTIFGTTGTATILSQCTSGVQATCEADTACRWNTGACEINPWHIRAGITVASKAGSLKTNCRNTIDSSKYNWDGSVASLIDTGSTAGTAYDFWDTIDDYYGLAPNKVTAWSSNTQCDSGNWTDVTTTNGGSSFTTCGTSSTCIYRDELSGLRVTGILSSGNNTTNTASPATYTWSAAINACNGSTYGGYGAGTWRLPTQKELMSMYEHGIVSRVAAGFHTLGNFQVNYYWSSSGASLSTDNGWIVNLAYGTTYDDARANTSYALCVY